MIKVFSEIKPLKKVLLHRPGNELNIKEDQLTGFLFDELPDYKKATKEHDSFAKILQKEGVEVLYLEDLFANVIKDKEIKEEFLKQFLLEANISRSDRKVAYNYFSSIKNPKKFTLETMSGLYINGRMIIEPLPNLVFTRDHFASIGSGISLNKMYTEIRRRETIYSEYIFKYHHEYNETLMYYNRYEEYNIEGGDIMNLNEKTLIIGTSQRTQTHAVEKLAKHIFEKQKKIKTIYAVDIPHNRAYMHLDTVLTQMDKDKFVIFPGILGKLDVYVITKDGFKQKQLTIQEILEKELNRKITLVKCGGEDKQTQKLEQWNDGANVLCIKPGVVVGYKFNTITNDLIRKAGVKVLELDGPELSKGRGGARCMSMPLERS